MNERIVCKPSPWFLLRAAALLLMFGVFAVLFFVDGKWAWKEKNLAYFTNKAFEDAAAKFTAMKPDEETWKAFSSSQTMHLGDDPAILPEGTVQPAPWPRQLQDYQRMANSTTNWKEIYEEFRLEAGIKKSPPAEPYGQRKLTEQFFFSGVSTVLFVCVLFLLVRTLTRTIQVDDTMFYPANGPAVPIASITRLDLRKWDTKGVAYAWTADPQGKERKIRIDGFVYGGFKKEQGEPAEVMMKKLRAGFSGEILQYVREEAAPESAAAPEA